MKVPLSWLAEWIDLPPSPDELALRLTLAGFEVEEIERRGPDLSHVRVGHVLERSPHPNADRLSVCRVDTGGDESIEVVCGAPNVEAGQKIAFAAAGSVLPDGTRLKKSKIRGVVSRGMICSERELGLGEAHEGILVLDPEAPIGAPLAEVMPTGDVVLDVAITPNRGDCASMLGLARETRALFGGEIRTPEIPPREDGPPAAEDIRITIDDSEGCYRYAGRVVRGVRVGRSPEWLVHKLEAAGLRSINSIVDVTNLVLLEFGQPLHAFDLAALRGAEIRVRSARDGEKITTLDGEERELVSGDLVIADAERPVAIAGIMGGAESEVRETTRDIVLESAHFEPGRVRLTARRLGLQTEASYRFERGVDPAGIARAVDRAARLLAELTGGTVASGSVEARGAAFIPVDEIALDPAHPNRLLGTRLSREEVIDLLARVEVGVEAGTNGSLRCRLPSYRNDLAIAVDLVEEVARVYGYDRIDATMPAADLAPVSLSRRMELEERVRDAMRGAGLLEMRSFPMIGPDELDRLRLSPDDERRRVVTLLNPVIDGESLLRSSLVPSLLRAAQRNLARQVDRIRLFEVAPVFIGRDPGELPSEPLHVCALVTGGERPGLWDAALERSPFFEIKGVAERFLAELGRPATFRAGEVSDPYLHPGVCVDVVVSRQRLGSLGEIHPETARAFEIDARVAVLSLDLTPLLRVAERPRSYREVSRQPAARRDLAVLLDDSQRAGEVLDAIRKTGGETLVFTELFDRYEGEGIPPGKVSLAFRMVFQRQDRALKEAEVAKMIDRVRGMLSHRFGAELR